jgi:hypothetical protein
MRGQTVLGIWVLTWAFFGVGIYCLYSGITRTEPLDMWFGLVFSTLAGILATIATKYQTEAYIRGR